MFGSRFYHGLIKKYIVTLGTLINDIHITRTDEDGDTSHIIRVPLQYAAKHKVLARLVTDPNIDREAAIVLPRMSFQLMSLQYDQDRKLEGTGRIVKKTTDPSKLKYNWNPVPYNLMFDVNIYVKNAEDGTKIIEQILPYFTPDWTPSVELIPEMGFTRDIPIVLVGVTPQDLYEGDFRERQVITWTLNFMIKGYLYGPTTEKKIIKYVKTNFVPTMTYGDDPVARITVTPGLLANGSPTTSSSSSISPLLINIDDDYGFCEDVDDILLSE